MVSRISEKQDIGEAGYSGATVTLNTGQTTTTDSNGTYTFSGLRAGIYTDTVTLPTGYSATTTNPATVALSANTTQNFGIVKNPPSLAPLSNATITEGGTYSSSGSFTDPGATNWSATVDYGDGTGVQPLSLSGQNFSLSHLYKDNKSGNTSYTVTVNVTDTQSALGTQTATVA
ncbi:MAG: SdrD B-like domain-containing protein, partial [Candidatus Levyibacteriota bacterium]